MEEDNKDYASLLLDWYRREKAKGNIPEPTEEDKKRADELASRLLDWYRRQKQEESTNAYKIQYIYSLTDLESMSFNLLFSKLFLVKDEDYSTTKRWLSGFRKEKSNTQRKLQKPEIKKILFSLHKKGLISIMHGRVRIGSIGQYTDYLTDENKKMVKDSLK